MRWILLITVVFGLCGGIAISYWRQANIDVSPSSMVWILVVLPSVIVASIYGIVQLKKWLKERREVESYPSSDAMSLLEQSEMPWLHIYAITVQTQLGNHADQIIAGLQEFRAAECDDELWNINGSKLLSRRIDLVVSHSIDDSERDISITDDLIAKCSDRESLKRIEC